MYKQVFLQPYIDPRMKSNNLPREAEWWTLSGSPSVIATLNGGVRYSSQFPQL